MAITVQDGDTLWSLADSHLGSATEWWRLYRANLAVIHAEQQRKARSDPEWARRVADRIPGPDFIFPGTFLILPEEET